MSGSPGLCRASQKSGPRARPFAAGWEGVAVGTHPARRIRVVGCLKGYDDESEYPEASGCSFTRYFFPSGFEAGWRLAGEAKVLWEAFQHVRAEAKLPGLDPTAVLERHYSYYELILVDDRSTDGTVSRLSSLLPRLRGVRLICLSRSFGQEIARPPGTSTNR